MNLLRKKSWDILKLYTVTSRKGFANLSNDAKMKLSKSLSSKWFKLLEILNDPKRYYEELLKEADVSEKGLYNIESNHLTQILQRYDQSSYKFTLDQKHLKILMLYFLLTITYLDMGQPLDIH